MEPIEIHFGDTFGQNLVRLAGILNRQAIKQLAPASLEPENIHEARLCFKRLRSLIRMSRHGLDKGEFRRINTFYRDQARAVAGQRDFTVISETLKPLIKIRQSSDEKEYLIRFKAGLHVKRRKNDSNQKLEKVRNEVIHNLTKMQVGIATWEVIEDKPELYLLGLQNTYRLGRKQMAQLKHEMTDHLLHEWRKQVKYLWYHLELVLPLWPVMIKAWIKEMKTLSQMLGRHHDLFLLETALAEFVKSEPPAIPLTLPDEICREKRQIEKDALLLGSKLFSLRKASVYRLLSQCI